MLYPNDLRDTEAARRVELEGILSEARHHARAIRALQTEFDLGTQTTHAEALVLQRHRQRLKALRRSLPPLRLVEGPTDTQ